MPITRASEHPTYELGGNTITGLMSPSRGSTENILYRIDAPPGGRLLPHRHDHEDLFTLLAGSGILHIDAERYEIGAGDAAVVPVGAEHWVEAGADGCSMLVAMLVGTLFIRGDDRGVPPWGE